MWNILFVVFVSIGANINFENISTGWKIAFFVIGIFLEAMILRNECLQEEQRNRIKALEERVKELVGEDK